MIVDVCVTCNSVAVLLSLLLPDSKAWFFIITHLPFLHGSGLLALHVLSHVVLGPVIYLIITKAC